MTMSGWMRLVLSSLSDSKQYITPGNKLVKRLYEVSCRIPDDCIDSKRYPLFMARDVMRVLIEQLQAEGATPS